MTNPKPSSKSTKTRISKKPSKPQEAAPQSKRSSTATTRISESADWAAIEKRVYFKDQFGNIRLGNEIVTKEIAQLLKNDAKNFKGSVLYEVIQATIANAAKNEALVHSTDWEEVLIAKALYKWVTTMDEIINELS